MCLALQDLLHCPQCEPQITHPPTISTKSTITHSEHLLHPQSGFSDSPSTYSQQQIYHECVQDICRFLGEMLLLALFRPALQNVV